MGDVQFDFCDKSFVVVGASSGIGRQITKELAESGANVLAVARNRERLEDLTGMSSHIQIRTLDVLSATPDDWNALATAFVEEYGKIHGAVYTAGISGATPLRGFDEAFAYRIMETSFWGAVRALQSMTKKKFSHEKASFVLFSSVAGVIGGKGMCAYAAAKAAVIAGVKTLAHDLARDGKRLNSISPGYVRTEMTRLYENTSNIPTNVIQNHLLGIGEANQVSGMALFLLSNRAEWITGQNFVLDGGYLCGPWN